MKNLIHFALYGCLLISLNIHAFNIERIHSRLGIPWGMAFINDQELLITERSGKLKKFNIQTRNIQTIKGLPKIMDEGQGGLLDIKIHPRYPDENWLYFTYSKEVKGEAATVLARAQLAGATLKNWQDLLITQSRSSTGRHFGSRIAFDEKGYLYFSVGDRGVRPNGQDTSTHAGSILRLNPDGSIPESNPFYNNDDVLDEIWSYGHRNPQGMAYDFANKRLWSIEHGPRGGDEINLIQPGYNYGWPVISYGKEYWAPLSVGEGTHRKGMEQPVKYYDPSIAPSSLMVYQGHQFPEWKGKLFSGALKLRHINIVTVHPNMSTSETRILEDMNERIRNVIEGPDELIYFSTDSGKIFRITP